MRARVMQPAGTWLAGAATGFLAGILVMQGAGSPAPPPLAEREPPSSPPVAVAALPTIAADPLQDLRRRRLTLPVQGLERDELRDTFEDMRGGGSRRHEALDIAAPRNTPVLAVEDGTIEKLFTSERGGLTE